MMESHPLPSLFWYAITRLGESEILLPAFLFGALWLALARPAGARGRLAEGNAHAHDHPARGAALRWAAGICVATFATTATKIAFLGYGIGSAALDFTGISGHSMYATSILPVLAAIVWGRPGAVAGLFLALGVVVSRVEIGAHSWSEAVAGAVIGSCVAGWTLASYLNHPGAVRVPWWLPPVLGTWLVLLPWQAPPSRTHDLVIAVSLQLSGRPYPYTRYELLSGLISPAGPL